MINRIGTIIFRIGLLLFRFIPNRIVTDTAGANVDKSAEFTTAKRICMDLTNNRYFVTDGNTVLVYSLEHVLLSTITQANGVFNNPFGMCVDVANNRLMVVNKGNNTLTNINLTTLIRTGSVITLAAGYLSSPNAIDFDENYYYIANNTSSIVIINRTNFAFFRILLQGTVGSAGAINDLKVHGNRLFYVSSLGFVIGIIDTITHTLFTTINSGGFTNFSLLIDIDTVNRRFVAWGQGQSIWYYYDLDSLGFIKSTNWTSFWGVAPIHIIGIAMDTTNKRMIFINQFSKRLEIVNYI